MLVSDAGAQVDPGALLIRECINNDISVTPLPGASAVTTALAISGFSEKFFFYSFRKIEKHKWGFKNFISIKLFNYFFYIAKKINNIIDWLKTYFDGRKIVICREMSKLYEEFIRTNIGQLNKFDKELKGELTIVISEKIDAKKTSQELSESDKRNINKMINKFSIKEIVNVISSNNKIPKKEIYNYCLKIKNEN